LLAAGGKYKNTARPDLILLDLNLPVKDGREVLAQIKEDPDLKRIPVVILTTSKPRKTLKLTISTLTATSRSPWTWSNL